MHIFHCFLLCLAVFTEAHNKDKDKYRKCDENGSIHDCKVNLPQKDDYSGEYKQCDQKRRKEVARSRYYYNLTTPPEPNRNPNNEPLFPRLNQKITTIALNAIFGDDDTTWLSNYEGMRNMLLKTTKVLNASRLQMDKYADYRVLYLTYLETINTIPGPHFKLPLNEPEFFDIIKDEKWKQDKYFVQRRLAGTCPYLIRLVNPRNSQNGFKKSELSKILSTKFNWNEHFSKKYKTTMSEAIQKRRVFVLYHELYSKLPQFPDKMDDNPRDDIKLRKSPSPISIFMINDKKELEIVAIQIEDKVSSNVYTPNDGEYKWLQAKGAVEIVDMAYCQLIGHLLETHVTQEVICNLYRRQLGKLHPIYQVMYPHCEGTTPVSSLGLPLLLDPNNYMDNLFNIGYIGSRILVNEKYKQQRYDHADFENQLRSYRIDHPPGKNLENQGLDKETSEIGYYPYRDDGKLIWDEIKRFAAKYVKLYYKKDNEVINDWELQSFVRELSADAETETNGKYKGFPSKFTKRDDVTKFLTRFIWLTVQHAANSYPLQPYGAYVPLAATKLYDNPKGDEKQQYARLLPNLHIALMQEQLIFTLSSYRLNRLFDYYNMMDDGKARRLVKETFTRLNICVQKELEARNSQRFKNNDLTYQYMEPKWLPNSIHS